MTSPRCQQSGASIRPTTVALVITLTLALHAAPLAAEAQPVAKVPRIGYLSPSTPSPTRDAFREGLRELGRVEGQNLVIEYRWAEGKFERLPEFAAEFVRLGVDVIVAPGTPAALAAKNATRAIPIVIWGVSDPLEHGLVSSLARPGGNVTGLSILGPPLSAKSLQLLKEVVPKVSQIAVISNPANPAAGPVLRDTKAAAQSLGLKLQLLEARGPGEFDSAFAAISAGSGALYVLPDPIFYTHRKQLVDLALKRRLPTMYWVREQVEAGGLMSYSANLQDNAKRAALYVDRILKGAKPGDLPVEQPTKFDLVINRASREG